MGFAPVAGRCGTFAAQDTLAMNSLLRKHSSSLLTIVIYATIILFSVMVSFDLV